MIYYFAYGSNIDEDDFKKWCKKKELPMVRFQNPRPAKLNGYKLTFNYHSTSRDGGAANIMEGENDCVYGLLMEIQESDLETIRKKEGYYSKCYNEIYINLEKLSDGTKISNVKTYKVVKNKEKAKHQPPTEEYMQLIIKNAKKYRFPQGYIKYLESIKTKK